MKALTLSNVNCKYGAPMGRGNILPINKLTTGKLQIRLLNFVDVCYDEGGAYWGSPANLYQIEGSLDNENSTTQIFLRADSRKDAKIQVQEMLPNVKFYQ